MKTLKDVGLLFWRPFVQTLRNPVYVPFNISTALMYLVLFMPLLKKISGPGLDSHAVIQAFLPGIIALLFFSGGTIVVWTTIFELQKGLTERLRVTPASRSALLIGPILSWLVWTLISAAVMVAVSVPFGFEIHAAGLAVFALLLAMVLIIFGAWAVAVAILMKGEIVGISGVVVGINLPVILLAGVMLPLRLGPGWMRALAHIDPLYYVVEAGRRLAVGQISTHAVGLAFAVITPVTVLVLAWATKAYQRAVA
jgi:ABC-2 type transport system permease protein